MRHYALPVAWVLGSSLVVYGSTLGNPYLTIHGVGLDEQHRLGIALTFLLFVTVECAIVAAILRPRSYARSWVRALTAALFLSVCHWFFFMPLHQPVAVGFHAMWLLAFAVTCWILCIVSAASVLIGRLTPNKSLERTREG
jgi:hypothetical protein